MPDFRVDSIVNREAIDAEKQYLISTLGDLKERILDIKTQVVTVKSADVSNYTQVSQDLNKTISDSVAATTKATAANKELTKAQIEARLANQQRTAAIKDEIISNNAAAGSYIQLQQQLKSLTAQYKALSETERSSPIGKQMAVDIATTNAQLKILDAGLGNYQRNVGNYNNSLGLLAKGVRGVGGIGVILAKALGIDPAIAEGIREAGVALRDLQHARELQEVGLKETAALYDINTAKIDATSAALDGETISTIGAVEANAGLAASTEEASIAQEGLIANTTVVREALDAEAVSADAATVSTEALSTSMGSGLVGGAILALAAIVALYEAISDVNSGAHAQADAYNQLELIMGDIASAAKSFEEARQQSAQKELKDLSNKIDLNKAAGLSALETLAQDKILADAELKNSNEQIKRYNINKDNVDEAGAQNLASASILGQAVKKKEQLLTDLLNTEDTYTQKTIKLLIEGTDKVIEQYKKDSDAKKANYDLLNGIYEKNVADNAKANLLTAQADKLNADEKRALLLATASSELEITQSNNAKILNSDASLQSQKIAALKSNQAAQLAVIKQTLDNTLNDPTKKEDKNLTDAAQAEADAKRVKVNNDTQKQIQDTNIKFRTIELKGVAEFKNALLKEDEDRAKDSITDRYTELQANLDAVDRGAADEKQVLTNNYELELALGMKYNAKGVLQQTLTLDQQKALKEKFAADSLAIDTATNNKEMVLQEKAFSDQAEAFRKLYDVKKQAKIDVSQTGEDISSTTAIDKAIEDEKGASAFKRTKIEKDLQLQLSDIAKKGEIERLNNEIEQKQEEYEFEKATNTLILGDEAKYQADIAALQRKKAEKEKEDAELLNQQRKEAADIEIASAEDVSKSISEIVDNQYQKQIDIIERLRETEAYRYTQEKDAINNSTLSNQQKTAETILLDKQAADNKRRLDIKEAQIKLKQAKFDRDSAIVSIGVNTAVGISKAFAELGPFAPAAAVAIGLAGLAQIAAVESKPLPTLPAYAEGIESHPGGYALFGEAGKEQIDLPSGRSFIADRPTVQNLPKGTKVTPFDDIMDVVMYNAMMQQTVRKVEDNTSKEIISAIHEGAVMTVRAMKKQKGTNVTVNVNANWYNHINKSVRE